jgi:MFS family permease
MSISFVIVAQLSGWLTNRLGPRLMLCGGMGGMGLGMLMMAFAASGAQLLPVEAALLVIGVGLGLNTAPVQNVAVASVAQERAGTASGLVNTARMVGATLGVAVLGLLFAVHGDAREAGNSYWLPYVVGGCAELLGVALAILFIDSAVLKKKS